MHNVKQNLSSTVASDIPSDVMHCLALIQQSIFRPVLKTCMKGLKAAASGGSRYDRWKVNLCKLFFAFLSCMKGGRGFVCATRDVDASFLFASTLRRTVCELESETVCCIVSSMPSRNLDGICLSNIVHYQHWDSDSTITICQKCS